MSKKTTTNLSQPKPEELFCEEDEDNFLANNDDDDYEKEENNVNTNNTNNVNKNDTNNNNNGNNNNSNDSHNSIKERLLKMEAETKKITQMQKYESIINNNGNINDNDNIDNENDEIIEIYSTSSNHNNNNNELNEETSSSSTPQKLKTPNANVSGNGNGVNANTIKSNETIDEQNKNNQTAEYPSPDDQKLMDERSIFINNLHTDTTASELQQLFATCGTIERITIVCDKWTGKPKGCSYIQFKSKESIDNAMILNGREVKGKIISVEQKRTNLPKWLRGRGAGRPRGRGAIGRGGRGRGYYMPPYYIPAGPLEVPPMMMPPSYGYYRGGPGGVRGYRSRGYWHPY